MTSLDNLPIKVPVELTVGGGVLEIIRLDEFTYVYRYSLDGEWCISTDIDDLTAEIEMYT